MGSAESIILSVGGTESMMLSACSESMIVSAMPAESVILSVPFDCVITLTCYSNSDVAGCRYRFSGKPISTYMSLTLARLCGEWRNGRNGRTGVMA